MFLLSFGEFFNVYFWRINEVFARTSRRTTWPPSPEIKATELSILSNVSFWMIFFSNNVVFVMTSFGTTQCCFQLKASRWLLQQCDVCYISPTLNYSTWPTNKINLTQNFVKTFFRFFLQECVLYSSPPLSFKGRGVLPPETASRRRIFWLRSDSSMELSNSR